MKALKRLLIGAAMPLLFLCCPAQAQQSGGDEPVSREQQAAIIQKSLSLLRSHYVFPERIAGIEAALKENSRRHRYDTARSLFAFLELLNRDLEESGRDHHLNIFYGPAIVAKLRSDTLPGPAPSVPPEYLRLLAYENFRLRKAERLDGNIGYLKLNGFVELEHARPALSAALNFIANASAVVLDLRENGGGSAETAHFLMSCFLPDSTLLGTFSGRKEYPVRCYTHREPGLPVFEVPLFILVSNRTCSAAEAVAYGLQQRKRAIVIGGQTKGEANPGLRFAVSDKLYMMVPTVVNRDAVTGSNWEGGGVRPDRELPAEAALAGALAEACRQLAAADSSNNIYAWLLPEYEAQLHPSIATDSFLLSIAGNYAGGRQVVREAGQCFYVSRDQKRRLTYMGKDLFSVEGRPGLRLRFPAGDRESCNLQFIWNDGSTETVGRMD